MFDRRGGSNHTAHEQTWASRTSRGGRAMKPGWAIIGIMVLEDVRRVRSSVATLGEEATQVQISA